MFLAPAELQRLARAFRRYVKGMERTATERAAALLQLAGIECPDPPRSAHTAAAALLQVAEVPSRLESLAERDWRLCNDLCAVWIGVRAAQRSRPRPAADALLGCAAAGRLRLPIELSASGVSDGAASSAAATWFCDGQMR